MGFVSHRVFRRSLRRRFVSAMLAAMYVVTAAGIPLPAGNPTRKSGELFPCSDDACGCVSAEQCWRSCCCHSLAERFEWAREHKVRPPEFAIAEARRAGIDISWSQDLTAPGSAGGISGAESMVCSTLKKSPAEPGANGLVAMAKVRCCCSERHAHGSSNSKTASRVIGWKALNCQGHSANWLAAVPTMVSANCGEPQQHPFIEWLGPALSEHANRAGDLPAIPPPKTVLIFTV
jgi:hypothetical protein